MGEGWRSAGAARGIEDLTPSELRDVAKGGRFVVYQWCVSAIFLTFTLPSRPRFIPSGKSAVLPGLGFSALTMLTGWWGFPWGPIRTIAALATNLGGGHDVTSEVMASLAHQTSSATPPPPGAGETQRPPPAPNFAPGAPGHSPRASGPLGIKRSLIAPTVGLAGAALIAGALIGLTQWLAAPDSTASTDLTDDEPQLLVRSSPGQTVELVLVLPRGIRNYWAAPEGVQGTVATPDRSTSIVAFDIPATDPNWGDSIRVGNSEGSSQIKISSQFEVPEELDVGSVLEGRMRVRLVQPVLARDSFRELTHDTTVDMTLIVDDVERGSPIALLPVIGLAGAAGTALFARGITLARRHRRSIHAPLGPPLTPQPPPPREPPPPPMGTPPPPSP